MLLPPHSTAFELTEVLVKKLKSSEKGFIGLN